jgi:hypothetical protein
MSETPPGGFDPFSLSWEQPIFLLTLGLAEKHLILSPSVNVKTTTGRANSSGNPIYQISSVIGHRYLRSGQLPVEWHRSKKLQGRIAFDPNALPVV